MLQIITCEVHGAFESDIVKAARKLKHLDLPEFSHHYLNIVQQTKWRHLVPSEVHYQILLFENHIEVWRGDKFEVRERLVLKVHSKFNR